LEKPYLTPEERLEALQSNVNDIEVKAQKLFKEIVQSLQSSHMPITAEQEASANEINKKYP